MAKGNMIVTLVAQTKKFQDGLSDAGKRAQMFGKVVGSAMNVALGALGLLAGAIFMFLPNFIKMGEEARKSELRLGNIAKQMGLFGENTDKVTKRMSKYAEALSFTTGVDDELIRSAQAVMLTFKELGDSADEIGGPFDRATKAAIDLAAAGFGDVESNAIQLGKALQDPVKGLTALRRAGVTFTEAQRAQIETLIKQNNLLAAQEIILGAIETQVGGTAEATASATDKMAARFENVMETLSLELLPAVDELANAFSSWLESEEGKKQIEELVQSFRDFGRWITSPEGKKAIEDLVETMIVLAKSISDIVGAMVQLAIWAEKSTQALAKLNEQNSVFNEGGGGAGGRRFYGSGADLTPAAPSGGNTSAPGGARGLTVNVNGITPTAAVGRTVQDALNQSRRLGVR